MAVEKPASVAASPFKSAKWDEVTSGREFRPCDAPVLAMLCQWYEVVDKCMADMDAGDGISVAYMNDMGDLKALPQVGMMKQASAEIRALNKQLGIDDEAPAAPQQGRVVKLDVIRQARQSKAANRRGAAAG